MLLSTTETILGKEVVEYLGLVSSIVPAAYTGSQKMMSSVHRKYMDIAKDQLAQEADELGADAVVGIRYAAMGNHHVLIGTAVKLK